MNIIYSHMFLVFLWALTLSGAIKSAGCSEKDGKFLTVLSLVFMLGVLGVGVKLMLMMPQVAKSGMWLHVKLSIDILAMLVNVFLVYKVLFNKELSKKFSIILYWSVVVMFVLMYLLAVFKPF